MDYRYSWHIRPARSHDSDPRLGSRVMIRELSHPRAPTFAPPPFHRAGPPTQLSQEFERGDGNESADMSISEESADDDLPIAQAEQPALAAQEEMSAHQEVDVELELSLTGGWKKKIQHGTSTARVDARPSGADIHPFLSLSISPPSTTVPESRQPPPPHAPARPGQSSDDVGKVGIGGLPLDIGEGLRSHSVQRENKEIFREASAEDVDWDWRERLVQGATSDVSESSPPLLPQGRPRRRCFGRWPRCGESTRPRPLCSPPRPPRLPSKRAALCCGSRDEGAKRSSLWRGGRGGLFCEETTPSPRVQSFGFRVQGAGFRV